MTNRVIAELTEAQKRHLRERILEAQRTQAAVNQFMNYLIDEHQIDDEVSLDLDRMAFVRSSDEDAREA